MRDVCQRCKGYGYLMDPDDVRRFYPCPECSGIPKHVWRVEKGRMTTHRLVTNGKESFVVMAEDAIALTEYLNELESLREYGPPDSAEQGGTEG